MKQTFAVDCQMHPVDMDEDYVPSSPVYAPDLPGLLLRLQSDEPGPEWAWEQLRETIAKAGGDKTKSPSFLESYVGDLCPTATETASLVQALCAECRREHTSWAPLQVTGMLLGVEVFCSRCPGDRQPNVC